MASLLEIQPPEPPRPRRPAKRRGPKRPISDAEAIDREFVAIRRDLAGIYESYADRLPSRWLVREVAREFRRASLRRVNSEELAVPAETGPRRALDRELSGRSSSSILARMRGSSPLPSPEQLAAHPSEGRELIDRTAQATRRTQSNCSSLIFR
ncbi:hypothetical protein [Nannocystis exedens]|nr:hypothetical protein [Nannocystis exedens]